MFLKSQKNMCNQEKIRTLLQELKHIQIYNLIHFTSDSVYILYRKFEAIQEDLESKLIDSKIALQRCQDDVFIPLSQFREELILEIEKEKKNYPRALIMIFFFF